MKDETLDVLNYINPALVEEVELLKPQRLTPRLRAAVLAACLCLALVGTGMAVTVVAGFRRIEYKGNQFSSLMERYCDELKLWGSPRYIRIDQLSPVILDMAKQHPAEFLRLSASSKESLSELTGLDLPNGLTYDALTAEEFQPWMNVTAEGYPGVIRYTETYRIRQREFLTFKLTMEVLLYTEKSEWNPTLGISLPVDWEPEVEEYRTENGLSVLLISCRFAEDEPLYAVYGSESYSAHFILDGIEYRICAQCSNDSDLALEVLKDALEDFQP